MKSGIKIFITISLFSFFTASTAQGSGLPERLPVKRGPSSFTQGYKVFNKKCAIHKTPSAVSKKLFYAEAGKRIWVTALDSQWLVAVTSKSKREVYIPNTCLR